MLVLSRRVFETLMIGDNVEVTVLRINGNRVSLGIKAGNETRIIRAELKSHSQGGACPTTFPSTAMPSISTPISNPSASPSQ